MGVSTSFAEIDRKIGKYQDLVSGPGLRKVVERVSLKAKNDAVAVIRRDVPSMRVRNAGNAKLGARYDVKGVDNPVSVVRATGPLHLVANPAKRHLIIPKGLGTLGTARKVTDRLGAQAAFGGSGRGTFSKTRRTHIGSKRAIAEGRGRKAAQALTIGSNVRGYAFHPGHRGKGTWGKAADRMERNLSANVAREMRNALTEGFR